MMRICQSFVAGLVGWIALAMLIDAVVVRAPAGSQVAHHIHMPPSPFKSSPNALHGIISDRTLDVHYNGHLRGYVKKLNAWLAVNEVALPDPRMAEGVSLSIVTHLVRTLPQDTIIYNMAAQVFNHALYFAILKVGEPLQEHTGFGQKVIATFKSLEAFEAEFESRANAHFGSGWVWLLHNKTSDELVIVDTHDARTPIADGNAIVPLLVIDVWEHSYYLDYENDRSSYVDQFFRVVNWRAVETRFDQGRVEFDGSGDFPAFFP